MPSYLTKVVPFHYRANRRRRSMGLRPIDSFKQVTVDGPASRAAATNILHQILLGVDHFTAPATNIEVPTGAKVFSLLIMGSFMNLTSVALTTHFNITLLRSGQAAPVPGVIGGSNVRNQVIYTQMKMLGKDQNNNLMVRVKVPRSMQRIREGDNWFIQYQSDAVISSITQCIYKFYR